MFIDYLICLLVRKAVQMQCRCKLHTSIACPIFWAWFAKTGDQLHWMSYVLDWDDESFPCSIVVACPCQPDATNKVSETHKRLNDGEVLVQLFITQPHPCPWHSMIHEHFVPLMHRVRGQEATQICKLPILPKWISDATEANFLAWPFEVRQIIGVLELSQSSYCTQGGSSMPQLLWMSCMKCLESCQRAGANGSWCACNHTLLWQICQVCSQYGAHLADLFAATHHCLRLVGAVLQWLSDDVHTRQLVRSPWCSFLANFAIGIFPVNSHARDAALVLMPFTMLPVVMKTQWHSLLPWRFARWVLSDPKMTRPRVSPSGSCDCQRKWAISLWVYDHSTKRMIIHSYLDVPCIISTRYLVVKVHTCPWHRFPTVNMAHTTCSLQRQGGRTGTRSTP